MSDPTTAETPAKIARATATEKLAPLRRVTVGTAETPTMRERLARTLASKRLPAMNLTAEARERLIQQGLYQARTDLDAILREMLEPSEGFIDAMMRGFHPGEEPRQAMRDALVNGVYSILNETKD